MKKKHYLIFKINFKVAGLMGFLKKTHNYLCFKYNKNKTSSYFVAKFFFIDFKTILGQKKNLKNQCEQKQNPKRYIRLLPMDVQIAGITGFLQRMCVYIG